MMFPGILYISYDGILEPLGQSQVLSYLRHLAKERRIHLISFEKAEDWAHMADRESFIADLSAAGICWHPLRYHRQPSVYATAWDISQGIVFGLWLVVRHHLCIVHARSYVPSVMALVLKRLTGIKFLFDMRGFWADERVDGDLWSRNSRIYRLAKGFEQHFLLAADHVVTMTQAAIQEMQLFPYLRAYMPPVTVIPTCADLTRFKPSAEKHESKGLILGYVGSAGTWYLFDKVATCFKQLLALRPDARLFIVNRGEHSYIRKCLAAAGVPSQSVDLMAANHAAVPGLIARMDAAIFFIRPTFSKKASSPTRLAEFLGCGVPCLGNAGIGDMAALLEGERVGVVIRAFDDATLMAGLQTLLQLVADPATRTRCVTTAQRYFSLDDGVQRYATIYQHLESME